MRCGGVPGFLRLFIVVEGAGQQLQQLVLVRLFFQGNLEVLSLFLRFVTICAYVICPTGKNTDIFLTK